MKKFNLLIMLLTFVSSTIWAKETLYPFPPTQRGIKVVSESELITPDIKQDVEESQNQRKTLGYEETNDDVAGFLLNFKKIAPQYYKDENIIKDYDENLKHHYSQLKLSFPFHGIGVPEKNVIAYVGGGSFVNKGPKTGWNSVKVYFEQPAIGMCSYDIMKILSVQLLKKDFEHLINKKPSTNVIVGNVNTGFEYILSWYTDNSKSTLRCAKRDFDKNIINTMYPLAVQIDKYVTANLK